MTELPFSQIMNAILMLASSLAEFGRVILKTIGIPEIIIIGTYTINTGTLFGIILTVVTFYALIATSKELIKYILLGIIGLFILAIIGSVV